MPLAKKDFFHCQHRERQRIAYQMNAIVDGQNNANLHRVIPKQKKATRWRAGVCRLCGEAFQLITHEHAARHGFESADAMARAGVVDWLE